MPHTKIINLHIHSNYSDGKNTIQEIIRSAIKQNLDCIAITDHFSDTWKASIIPTLNNIEKINEYLNEIEISNQNLINENQNLIVLKGIEIDIGSSEKHILRLLDPLDFDIILFEYLETLEAISFLQNIISKWKRKAKNKVLPLFGLAHPDPSYFQFGNEEILFSFLSLNHIFYEFNSSYSQYYSAKFSSFFDKMREKEISVSIGCDSHSISNISDVDDSYSAIRNYRLEALFSKFIDQLNSRFDLR